MLASTLIAAALVACVGSVLVNLSKQCVAPGSSFAHANAHTVEQKKNNQIKCSLLRLFNHNKCSSSLAEYSVYLNRAGCEVSMYFNFFV